MKKRLFPLMVLAMSLLGSISAFAEGEGADANATAPQGGNLWIWIVIYGAMFALFYFLLIRPQKKKRSKHEIGISAVRGGNIVGDHEVIFAGNNEILEINHKALSRGIFGEGAVKAALYLWDKPKGMYNMDMLAEESLGKE